jgi:hypothetical protein
MRGNCLTLLSSLWLATVAGLVIEYDIQTLQETLRRSEKAITLIDFYAVSNLKNYNIPIVHVLFFYSFYFQSHGAEIAIK